MPRARFFSSFHHKEKKMAYKIIVKKCQNEHLVMRLLKKFLIVVMRVNNIQSAFFTKGYLQFTDKSDTILKCFLFSYVHEIH